MKDLQMVKTEYCVACQQTRPVKGVLSTREEDSFETGKRKITTVSYYCDKCQSFVGSIDVEEYREPQAATL